MIRNGFFWGALCNDKGIAVARVSLFEYRKIPKISPGAYIFQRPFLRGLFLEGLIFGGAYLWREICVSKSIGLALQLEVNLPSLLCFSLYLRAIFRVQAPRGLYLEERFDGGFFALPVKGAYIWRGLCMEGLFSEFYGTPRVALLLGQNAHFFQLKCWGTLEMGKYHWHLSFVYTMSRSCVGLGTLCFLAPTFNLFWSVSIALITLKYRIIQLLVNLIRFSF